MASNQPLGISWTIQNGVEPSLIFDYPQGADVTALQQFLAKDSSIYPEAITTGYYGALTAKAVGKFQEKYGIAKSGDSGYGYVWPATRAKLNEIQIGN